MDVSFMKRVVVVLYRNGNLTLPREAFTHEVPKTVQTQAKQ